MGRSTDFRRALRERGGQYLLAVPSNTLIRDLQASGPVYCGNGRPPKQPHWRADRWQREQSKEKWIRIDVGDGEKGAIIVEALSHCVASSKRGRENEAEETLVVIRSEDRDSKVTKTDYYLSNAPDKAALQEFCRVARAEHRIEECFERAKGQAGLADYEVRNWIGWQHHQTLSLMACWFLTLESQRAEKKDARDHDEPGPASDRLGTETDVGLRFDPCDASPNRTETQAKSTRQTVPLQTTKQTAANKPKTPMNAGQSNYLLPIQRKPGETSKSELADNESREAKTEGSIRFAKQAIGLPVECVPVAIRVRVVRGTCGPGAEAEA